MQNRKRLLALFLCAVLLAGVLPTARAEDRADITDIFTDPVFREAVYTSVRKQPGERIYDTDVAKVKELYVSQYTSDPEVKIQNLAGLEYFTGLEKLDITHCNLPTLDVRPLKHLKALYCGMNRLKELDLTGLNELERADCEENNLTELKVASPVLSSLRCDQNLLTELDLSGCPALESLNCEVNYLESLDLRACPKLRHLACRYNYMESRAAVIGFDPPEGSAQRLYFDPQNDERLVPRLDYDAREMICADYARICEDVRLSPEEVRIEKYYGCFDGLHLLYLQLDKTLLDGEPKYRRIGGYVFYFPNQYSHRFLAYRDGVFTPVQDAFESGLLTRTGLRALFDRFNENTSFPFADVAEDAWYYGSVRDAQLCLLFSGVSESRFAPDAPMTRAMLVAVLWRLYGEPYVDEPDPFDDVPDRIWYANAVTWAAKYRIVLGVGNGRFAPDSPVTREQVAAILQRLAVRPEPAADADTDAYPDFDAASPWAEDAVRWALACGVMEGSQQADGTLLLNPGASVTRAEAAALLMRYIDRLPDRLPVYKGEWPNLVALPYAEPPIHAQYVIDGELEILVLTNLLTDETARIDLTGLLPEAEGILGVYNGSCSAFGRSIRFTLLRTADNAVHVAAAIQTPYDPDYEYDEAVY